MTSNDYFLYKKYMNLAEKYKQKLKKRYNLFMENENIEENFDNIQGQDQGQNYQNLSSSIYSMKDIIIIIIIGIFIILALDVLVKMGARAK
jgi:subtilase family serine protease